MKLPMLLLTIAFILGCTDQENYLIRVEQDWVFVDNKKVANTIDIAKQDSFLVEPLQKALESREDTSKNCQIKIDPEQSYDVLYKIANTCNTVGYTNLSIASKINGENYILPFFLDKESSRYCYYCIHFAMNIAGDTLYAISRGGYIFKIFYKENLDSAIAELAERAIHVVDSFNRDFVYIYGGNDDTKISNIIPVMHKLRTSGFTEINLHPTYKPKPPTDWSKYHLRGGTFTDARDGKKYKTIKMAVQIWMAENLNYETSNGSWCYANDTNNCGKYGRLYDWNTAKNACPKGWHLPGEVEWYLLARKAKGIVGDLDKLDFSVLLGGYSINIYNNEFYDIDMGTYWWSTKECGLFNSAVAWSIYSDDVFLKDGRCFDKKTFGFSVRCVKD